MKPLITIFTVFSLFLLFSCNMTNVEAEKAEIRRTLTNMWLAVEEKNVEKYASYIHDDYTQFGENDATLNIGKLQEVEGARAWIKAAKNVHSEMIDPIINIRGKTAWIVYYWSEHGTKNGLHFITKGKSTRIFVKENGKWLCIHGHYTLMP